MNSEVENRVRTLGGESSVAELLLLRCCWATAAELPYFANLKVMRRVLGAVRDGLAEDGGTVGAYLFFEDRFLFLAEGATENLVPALKRTRRSAAEEFRNSDHKTLWGEVTEQPVPLASRDAEVLELLLAPVRAGLAPAPGDYPWCGGRWLLDRL